MNCSFHPTRPSTTQCPRCRTPLCGPCGDVVLSRGATCPRCPHHERPPAALSRRLLAHLVDSALLAVGVMLLPLLVRFAVPWAGVISLMLVCAALAVEFGWQLGHGRSVGKWLIGLRVVMDSGEPADLLRVIVLRNVLPLVLSAVCGIRFFVDLYYLVTPPHRRLGDRLAATRVVEDPRLER